MMLSDQWKPCSRCDQRQETVLCICSDRICVPCLEAHIIDENDPDFCEALRLNPELELEWDAGRRCYVAVKVD
jgi:hypothetical protein